VSASSTYAAGLPGVLNIKTPTQAITGANVAGTTPLLQALSGLEISCSAAKATATLEQGAAMLENFGPYHIEFTGCKSVATNITCTGEDGTVKDSAGTILALGTFKVVHDVTETGSTYGIVFTVNPDPKFECSALAKLQILGTQLCLITEPTVEKETHVFR